MHQFGAATNIGNQRDNNEDSYVCDAKSNLWLVADGMGGLGFGEVASAIAAHTITSMLQQGHGINQAIEVSHRKIQEYAEIEGDGTNMGTTLVLLYSQGSLYNIFWVGDSRAYLFDGTMSQLSHDHSLIQNLVDQGELSTEEAARHPQKSAITRALGVQERDSVRADSISGKWHENQKILLCSDGLTDCVSDEDIEQILRESASEQEATDKLIDKALAEGGKDNITVVLVAGPQNTESACGDTEVPTDDTAGWRDNESKQAIDATHVMDQQIITSAGTTAITERQEQDIPTLTETAGNSADLDASIDDVYPDYVRGNLLSDRYLIPLGLVLAVLLVWIMMFGASDSAVLDQTEGTELSEPADSDNSFAAKALDRDAMGPADDQKSMNTLSATQAMEDELIEASRQPPIQRNFPVDEVQDNEQLVYQLGVYSRLTNAEKFQQDLTRFGLFAHIDKLASNSGIQYSVILGPFQDPVEDARVVATLKREKVSYAFKPE